MGTNLAAKEKSMPPKKERAVVPGPDSVLGDSFKFSCFQVSGW